MKYNRIANFLTILAISAIIHFLLIFSTPHISKAFYEPWIIPENDAYKSRIFFHTLWHNRRSLFGITNCNRKWLPTFRSNTNILMIIKYLEKFTRSSWRNLMKSGRWSKTSDFFMCICFLRLELYSLFSHNSQNQRCAKWFLVIERNIGLFTKFFSLLFLKKFFAVFFSKTSTNAYANGT